MAYTQSAIWPYLYGFTVDWEMSMVSLSSPTATSNIMSSAARRSNLVFSAYPVPRTFAAVLFSNAGTLAKFDRIGVLAGYGAPAHRYFRAGMRYNPDPNAVVAKTFVQEVGAPGYEEGWADELQVFHNPNAIHPLPRECFAGLQQHFFEGGRMVTYSGADAVISSVTTIISPTAPE